MVDDESAHAARVVARVTGRPIACHDQPVSNSPEDADLVDFAVAAWREEGRWTASALPKRVTGSMESLQAALRQLPGEGGVFGFVGNLDDFFLIVRQVGNHSRVFVSDGTAVLDWPLADEAMEAADVYIDEDELEEFVPIGDLSILADFGIDSTEMLLMCEDTDQYPDDQVTAIAKKLGFGPQMSAALKSR